MSIDHSGPQARKDLIAGSNRPEKAVPLSDYLKGIGILGAVNLGRGYQGLSDMFRNTDQLRGKPLGRLAALLVTGGVAATAITGGIYATESTPKTTGQKFVNKMYENKTGDTPIVGGAVNPAVVRAVVPARVQIATDALGGFLTDSAITKIQNIGDDPDGLKVERAELAENFDALYTITHIVESQKNFTTGEIDPHIDDPKVVGLFAEAIATVTDTKTGVVDPAVGSMSVGNQLAYFKDLDAAFLTAHKGLDTPIPLTFKITDNNVGRDTGR